MSIEKKVPAIRFTSYSDSWIKKLLSDVLDERKILQKISSDAPILSFAAGQGVIDRSERKSNNRDHLTLDQTNKIYKLTEYNDIVYNPSNLKYGAIDRNKHGRGVISPIYVTFTTEEVPSFIEIIVKSEKFKLRALVYEEGTVVKRQSVKPENLLSLEVHVSPSLDEQTKIGNYFQQLDTLIAQHQQKHNKLLNLKKALLEKMFPKQGEKVPKIRFNGFNREWENKALGKITDSFSGGTPLVGNEEYYKGDIAFIRSGEINSSSTELFISDLGLNNSSARLVNVGCILYALYGATSGEVGLSKINGAINQAILAIIPHSEISSGFITQWLRKNKAQIIGTYLQGGQGNLSGTIVKNLVVDLPHYKEQTKIGNLFKQLDTLITQHQAQLKKLNNIKQACLEKMFV